MRITNQYNRFVYLITFRRYFKKNVSSVSQIHWNILNVSKNKIE